MIQGQKLNLIAGDTYDLNTNNLLSWTDDGTFPTLTGANILFTIGTGTNAGVQVIFSQTCSLLIGPPQIITASLSSEQTGQLTSGISYIYEVRAQMENEDLTTLVSGGQTFVTIPITNFGE
jgi:hypothetical protein